MPTDLARRAVACAAWKWMPGMLDTEGCRVYDIRGQTLITEHHNVDMTTGEWSFFDTGFRRTRKGVREHPPLPDLSDPATLGCLLALVREAWRHPAAQASPRTTMVSGAIVSWCWYINDTADHDGFNYATEPEALVAALEAAPSS